MLYKEAHDQFRCDEQSEQYVGCIAKLKIKKFMGILLYLPRQENKRITLISKSALLTRFTEWMEVTPSMNDWSIIIYK